MTFKTGCFKDLEDIRDMDYPVGKIFNYLDIPNSCDLTKYVDKIRYQGNTGSCTGFATTRAMHIRAQIQGLEHAKHASPLAAYTMGRVIDKFSPTDEIVDTGAFPRSVLKSLLKWGVCSEETWPLDESKINTRLDWTALDDGIGYKLGSYHWVLSSGSARFAEICTAIANGFPVVMRIDANETFMKCNSLEPIVDENVTTNAGHYVCAIGYDTDTITIVNSWGENWGAGGYGRLGYKRIADNSTTSIAAIETVLDEKSST